MLVSEIKSRFKVYYDGMGFNFSNQQLNKIFAKAQSYYFEGLMNKYGENTKNLVDVAPLFKRLEVTPASNVIPYSSLPNYNRVSFVKPTYEVDGDTYSYPAKPLNENNKYSSLSNGTIKYPRYFLQDDGIVLEPSITPTKVFFTYFRTPLLIDFTITDYDIPEYSEENVQDIIMVALNNVAQSQREYPQQQSVVAESQFNNQ